MHPRLRAAAASALALALLALGGAAPARAATASGADFVSVVEGPWEFGIDIGRTLPTQKRSFSHVIDNARAYDLLAAESVGDEVGEGFKAPPLPGNSTIAGTLRPAGDIGAHLYRRFTPWLAWGVDAGWTFKHDLYVDDPGIYQPSNFMVLHYEANIVHAALPAKLGPSIQGVRPYLLAGPGVYFVRENANISFNDSEDPQLLPLQIVGRNAAHFGVAGGVGLEWRVEDRGLIGLEVQYHRVFAGPDRVNFLLPKLRAAVYF